MPITLDGTLGITTPALTVSGATVNTGGISTAGNLTFTSTGQRILGDFSNATIANQLIFQSSTTNGNTTVYHIPNGTATTTSLAATNSSDVSGTSTGIVAYLQANSTDTRIGSGRLTASGTYLPMTFFVGGSERMRIDSSGNVGIGTTNLQEQLTVQNSIQMTNNASNLSGLYFGTNANPGLRYSYIQSDARSTGYINFNTNATERMRIDSSGNVGIGATPPALYGGSTSISFSASTLFNLQLTSNNQTRVMNNCYVNSSGNTIALNTDYVSQYSQGTALHTFQNSTASVTAGNTATMSTTLQWGYGSSIALQGASPSGGTGITFPATQSASSNANTLDDYEEGTWTPTLQFNYGSAGMTYSARTGNYVKIGKWVTITFDIALSAKGSSTGNATISGIPFNNYISLQLSAGILIGESGMAGFNQTNAYFLVWSDGNLYLRYNGSTAYANFDNNSFTDSSKFYGCVTYQTTD